MNLVLFLTSTLLVITNMIEMRSIPIQNVRFKPGTSVLPGERDGIVLVRWGNEKETSICNDGFDEKYAAVVCKTLGYPPKGYSIEASASEFKGDVTSFSCTGYEDSLTQCQGAYGSITSDTCNGHKRDVHVFCLEKKVAPAKSTRYTDCKFKNEEANIYSSDGKKNSGFLMVKFGGKFRHICDEMGDLSQRTAEIYCNKMCKFPTNPQIMSSYGKLAPGTVDYVNFNVNNNQPEKIIPTCPNYAVVGIECGDERVIPENSPIVTCTRQLMQIYWPADHSPLINDELIKFEGSCDKKNTYTMDYNSTTGLNIVMQLNKIEPQAEKAAIVYKCNLIRLYNTELRSEKTIQVQCSLPKHSEESENIGFRKATPKPLIQVFDFSTMIQLYTSRGFRYLMDKPYKAESLDFVYAKVSLISAPRDTKFVLKNCYVTDDYNSSDSTKVYLVSNGCSVEAYKASIYGLSPTVKGLGFSPDGITNNFSTKKLLLVCEGLKCFKGSGKGCQYCQKNNIRKRSIQSNDQFQDVPIAYEPINFG